MGWLSGYSYRKSHVVNAATGAGANYPIPIKVYSGSGSDSGDAVYLNNKAVFFPNDLAFTDDDGVTELKYWYEYDSNTFWVKVADSLESVNQTIYIYYGNASVLPNPIDAPTNAVWKRYAGNPVLPLGTDGTDDDPSTVSLLHMDGADASQTFTDKAIGGSPHVWTAYNHAQIDTAQSVFGGASGLFDGVDDYIDTPYSSDFDFGSGNFTWDFRVRFAALDTSKIYVLMGITNSTATEHLKIYIYYNGVMSKWVWNFVSYVGGIEKANYYCAWDGVVINTWYHMALVRNGTSLKLYINGTSITLTATTAISTNSITPAVQCKFTIGRNGEYTTAPFYTNAWFDEVRISKGIARWTANFIPPTVPYCWDNHWVQMHSMVYNPNDSKYYAYYMGSTDDWKYRIGLATSSDGITWTKSGSNPVLKGVPTTWEATYVRCPMVWVEGSIWYMLYNGFDGATNKIGLATSSDGITWTKSGSNPVITYNSFPGTQMLKEGDTYYLYHSYSPSGVFSVGLSTSTDLINWSAPTLIISPGAAGTYDDTWAIEPTIAKFGSTYYIWYEGVNDAGNSSRVALAHSANKDSGWIKDGVVVDCSPGIKGLFAAETIWDTAWTEVFVLVQVGNEWRGYFGGSSYDSWVQTGYVTYTKTGNGKDVFDLFDDFHGLVVDATLWNGTSTLVQDQDTAKIYIANNNTVYFLKSLNTLTAPLAIESKVKVGADWANEYGWLWGLGFDSAWQTTGYLAGHYKDAGADYTRIHKFGTGATNDGTNEAIAANTFYKYSLRVGSAAQKAFVSGIQKGSIATAIQTNPSNVQLFTQGAGVGSTFTTFFDWVFARKYTDPEPTHGAWGAEENAPVGAPYYYQELLKRRMA
jgi:predicted GH43/DUF377 family glycosyl hydrolase